VRKNFGKKTWAYPMPVFIIGTYSEDGTPNAMNAAWGGITEECEITVCIDSGHKTAENLMKTGAFTVSFADVKNVVAADYVGIETGNKVNNKTMLCGWTAEKSEFVNAPVFLELPMALECRVKSYDEERCLLVGEIVNVSCDGNILDNEGNVDPLSFRPIVYDPISHDYRAIGERVGKAFSDGLKIKKKH
jgi:flavin reductase (DIM6/NTAB) family NADH-FMN oxidoreductase RutF